MYPFRHQAATSPDAARALLAGAASAEARLLAGGTDLLPLMKADLARPHTLIDLKPARELRTLTFDGDGTLHIGALTTLAAIERSAELAERLPILPQSVRDAASPQLRAVATVGGNLLQRNRCWYFREGYACWLHGGSECYARDGQNKYSAIFEQSPCVAVHPSDLAPALVALDATVVVLGAAGVRTLPVAELLAPPTADRRIEHQLAAGEVIVEVRVPAQPAEARGVYLKAMDRRAWAFALVSAAAQISLQAGHVEQVRLVLGGVANVPWRVEAAERLLLGQMLTEELAAQVAEEALAGATPLAHNAYKVQMARALARRALLQAGSGEA